MVFWGPNSRVPAGPSDLWPSPPLPSHHLQRAAAARGSHIFPPPASCGGGGQDVQHTSEKNPIIYTYICIRIYIHM